MFWLAVTVALIAVVVIALIATANLRSRRDDPPIHHALQPIAGPSEHPTEQLPIPNLHDAPAGPMTVQQAHRVMQLHLDCGVRGCAVKRVAWSLLERAGHVKPYRNHASARRS